MAKEVCKNTINKKAKADQEADFQPPTSSEIPHAKSDSQERKQRKAPHVVANGSETKKAKTSGESLNKYIKVAQENLNDDDALPFVANEQVEGTTPPANEENAAVVDPMPINLDILKKENGTQGDEDADGSEAVVRAIVMQDQGNNCHPSASVAGPSGVSQEAQEGNNVNQREMIPIASGSKSKQSRGEASQHTPESQWGLVGNRRRIMEVEKYINGFGKLHHNASIDDIILNQIHAAMKVMVDKNNAHIILQPNCNELHAIMATTFCIRSTAIKARQSVSEILKYFPGIKFYDQTRAEFGRCTDVVTMQRYEERIKAEWNKRYLPAPCKFGHSWCVKAHEILAGASNDGQKVIARLIRCLCSEDGALIFDLMDFHGKEELIDRQVTLSEEEKADLKTRKRHPLIIFHDKIEKVYEMGSMFNVACQGNEVLTGISFVDAVFAVYYLLEIFEYEVSDKFFGKSGFKFPDKKMIVTP